MTTIRWVAITLVLALAALVIVYLRTEQARIAHETALLEAELLELERESWEQEAEISRLRAPSLIKERRQAFGTSMAVVPDEVKPATPIRPRPVPN